MARRTSPSVRVDLGLVATAALVIAVVVLGSAHLRPYNSPELDPRPALIPVYLLRSLARMVVAFLLAAILALAIGNLAARSRPARRLILPVLDVLQSVPILGFFPVAVAFFISMSRGSALGVEAAAVFLIFTSMFWNLAFGVYESLITVPEEMRDAADQFGLQGPLRWSRLVLPSVVPSVLYNSRVSWANGWFFLIASEIIAVGPARYTLPGLGSYLAQAVRVGREDLALLAIGVIVATTLAMHLLLWAPLEKWAERFHLGESGDRPQVPRTLRVLGRSRIVRRLSAAIAGPLGQEALTKAGEVLHFTARHWMVGAAVAGAALAWAGAALAGAFYRVFLERPLSPQIAGVPLDLLLSLGRVSLGVMISVTLSLPLAYVMSRHPRGWQPSLAVIQILASIPASAFFPLVAVLLAWGVGMNAATVLLALSTMFWYVLFNVLGAAAVIPKELREVADGFGFSRSRYLRRVLAPAILPGLVTGCVTAWGAGWNALILAEYVEAGGRRYVARGIGATLARATYITGDMQVVFASLFGMVLLIVLVNRFFWDPLYQRAAARYKMDA